MHILALHLISYTIITLRACARGKAIGCVVVDTKIGKSGDLGTWANCKHNEYVEFDEKLASELSGTAYKHHK